METDSKLASSLSAHYQMLLVGIITGHDGKTTKETIFINRGPVKKTQFVVPDIKKQLTGMEGQETVILP